MFHVLHHKLHSISQKLKAWSKKINSDAKTLFFMAQEVIQRLDIAQENRGLTNAELLLRAKLKKRILGLAVIERGRCKQSSRLSSIKMGDANTKNFHRKVNARRRKNHIQRLRHGHGWAINHDDKASIIQDHFSNFMGHPAPWQQDFNWDELHLPSHDLSGLDTVFTEEEIKHDVHQMPFDKAPGPDGYTGAFFRSCWDIIKVDVDKAANAFHSLRTSSFALLNSANMVLIPKKDGTQAITDF